MTRFFLIVGLVILCAVALGLSFKSTDGVTVDGALNVTGSLSSTNISQFNPAKTYIAVFGNSIALESATNWSTLIKAQWPNLAFYTNYAVGGSQHLTATNAYYSNALAVLPASATAGTNVLIVAYDALLTFNAGTWATADDAIAAYTAWGNDCHSRGFKLIVPTMIPAEYFPTVAQVPTVIKFNSWLKRSSNIVDYAPDFANVIPDCYDTNFISDDVHPTALGHSYLAKEFDAVVRLGERRQLTQLWRIGTNFFMANPDTGAAVGVLGANGLWARLRAGVLNTGISFSANTAGVFGSGHDDAPALYAQGNSGQASSKPVFNVGDFDSPDDFKVFPDGHFTAIGACVITGGGSGTLSTTAGFLVGSIPGITTTWTNMIPNVITQRISTIGGIVVTNSTL